MMRTLPLLALLAAGAATPVMAGDTWSANVTTGLGADTLWLVHDASGISPVLGSPTSILHYDTLVAPQLRLGVENAGAGNIFFDGSLALGYGQGSMGDMDFLAGGVVSSDTASALTLKSAAATLRFWPTAPAAGTFSPVAVLSLSRSSYEARGITCGEVCPGGEMPDTTPVLSLAATTVSGGLGWIYRIGEDGGPQLRLGGDLTLGRAQMRDSHLLRDDLGPQPNIAYDFATLGSSLDAEFTTPLGAALDFVVSGGVAARLGWGDITYRASSNPLPPQPAAMMDLSAHVGLGVAGRF